jgi:RNA polymerase sigma-B factor
MTSGRGRRAPREPAPPSDESEARDRLIEGHLGLARHVVRLFEHRGEPVDDLMQVASIGLVRAADRFDASLGFEFSTFATSTMVGELKRHFRDRAWAVKTPRTLQELYLEVSATVEELTQRLGHSPSVQEVASACDRRHDEVLTALEVGQGYRTRSLEARPQDAEFADDGARDELALLADSDELATHLARLDPRDREVVRLRFVDELSQAEIASQLGISQMHVSRLLRRALQSLRAAYGVAPEDDAGQRGA